MTKTQICGAAAVVLFASAASAQTIFVDPINRGAVDEQPPRVAVGDAPTGFGPDSWMNAANLPDSDFKVNAYISDDGTDTFGNAQPLLPSFGLAGVTVSEIESITYYTKTPVGADPWFVNFYTERDDAGDNDASWYGERFTLTADQDAPDANGWVLNTVNGARYTSGAGGTFNFADFLSSFGDEAFGLISPQTNSGDDGSDAMFDGLTLNLTGGRSVSADFGGVAVPEPASMLGLASLGLLALGRRRA